MACYSIPDEPSEEYTAVEVINPSEVEEELLPYFRDDDIEEDSDFIKTYAFVPIDIVEEIAERHGGLIITESFAKYFGGGLDEEAREDLREQ